MASNVYILRRILKYRSCLNILLLLQMKPLITAFARGMADLIDPKWLGLFNAKEFNQVRLMFLSESTCTTLSAAWGECLLQKLKMVGPFWLG